MMMRPLTAPSVESVPLVNRRMQTSGRFANARGLDRKLSIAHPRAFTLIEIVLVITIVSILGAALIYGIKGNVDVAKETRVDADIKAVVTQLNNAAGLPYHRVVPALDLTPGP